MPVEIRELIIRAVTVQDSADRDEQQRSEDRLCQRVSDDDQQAIVQECVRQVMRMLQQKKER
jgi:hypothetical protein